MAVSLDKIDITVLKALLQDGRASYSAIAKQTKLTDVAIKKRVESLKRKGVVSSITANLNYSVIGFENPLYFQLGIDLAKSKDIVKKLSALENVVELYEVSGEYNLLVKVILPDFKDSVKDFSSRLSTIDGVRFLKSLAVIDAIKKSNSLPSSLHQKKF